MASTGLPRRPSGSGSRRARSRVRPLPGERALADRQLAARIERVLPATLLREGSPTHPAKGGPSPARWWARDSPGFKETESPSRDTRASAPNHSSGPSTSAARAPGASIETRSGEGRRLGEQGQHLDDLLGAAFEAPVGLLDARPGRGPLDQLGQRARRRGRQVGPRLQQAAEVIVVQPAGGTQVDGGNGAVEELQAVVNGPGPSFFVI